MLTGKHARHALTLWMRQPRPGLQLRPAHSKVTPHDRPEIPLLMPLMTSRGRGQAGQPPHSKFVHLTQALMGPMRHFARHLQTGFAMAIPHAHGHLMILTRNLQISLTILATALAHSTSGPQTAFAQARMALTIATMHARMDIMHARTA